MYPPRCAVEEGRFTPRKRAHCVSRSSCRREDERLNQPGKREKRSHLGPSLVCGDVGDSSLPTMLLVGFTRAPWVGTIAECGQSNHSNATFHCKTPERRSGARHWMNPSATSMTLRAVRTSKALVWVLKELIDKTEAELWGPIHIIHRPEITITVTIYSRRAGWTGLKGPLCYIGRMDQVDSHTTYGRWVNTLPSTTPLLRGDFDGIRDQCRFFRSGCEPSLCHRWAVKTSHTYQLGICSAVVVGLFSI